MTDILDEVSHDLQNERYDRIIYYGMRAFLVVVTVILLGVTIYVWKENTSEKLQQQLSINYNKALAAMDSNNYVDAIEFLNQVIEHPSQQYAALAYLNKAAILIKQNKFDEAQKTLLEVNEHKNLDIAFRELAQTIYLSNQLAFQKIDNTELNKEIFDRITKDDKPWRLLALQILALFQIEKNQIVESKATLEKIMQSPDAGTNVKNITSSILSKATQNIQK